MKCPACANTNATCVIGSYWQCPQPGCVNNNGVDSKPSTEWVMCNDTWKLHMPPGSPPPVVVNAWSKPASKPANNVWYAPRWANASVLNTRVIAWPSLADAERYVANTQDPHNYVIRKVDVGPAKKYPVYSSTWSTSAAEFTGVLDLGPA